MNPYFELGRKCRDSKEKASVNLPTAAFKWASLEASLKASGWQVFKICHEAYNKESSSVPHAKDMVYFYKGLGEPMQGENYAVYTLDAADEVIIWANVVPPLGSKTVSWGIWDKLENKSCAWVNVAYTEVMEAYKTDTKASSAYVHAFKKWVVENYAV
jgi:hypothetical protein